MECEQRKLGHSVHHDAWDLINLSGGPHSEFTFFGERRTVFRGAEELERESDAEAREAARKIRSVLRRVVELCLVVWQVTSGR